MTVHIIGSFPSQLYRAFDKEAHARSFVEQGIFQMLPLHHYRDIEDPNRKDKDEGEGKSVINTYRPVYTFDQKTGKILSETSEFGPVYFGTESINTHYILCFSGPQVDVKYLAGQYGGYVVCINRPKMLVCDIASYLEQYSDLPSEMWLKCVQVRYDKGQSVKELPEPASEERTSMSYGQKDPKFSSDCEYRLVLTLPFATTGPPTKITVELLRRLEYAEILTATSEQTNAT